MVKFAGDDMLAVRLKHRGKLWSTRSGIRNGMTYLTYNHLDIRMHLAA